MKIKILEIITVVILLVSVASTVGQTAIEKTQKNEPTTLDDDVPIWSVGDSWTYTVNDFTFDYQGSSQKLYFDGSIADFTWTVVDTSGSTYTVDFTGKLNCEYDIYLSLSSLTLAVSGTMKETLTHMSGTLIFTKSNLQLQDMSAEIKGITMAKIYPLPIPFPIPFKVKINGDLSNEFPLFDFPLSTNKFWTLPDMDIVMSVHAGGPFGIIDIPITFSTHYSWMPLAFHCKDKKDITVEAGSFNAWEIESTFFDLFEYYYAPSVGNIIKIDATMPNGDINAELKSTNYS